MPDLQNAAATRRSTLLGALLAGPTLSSAEVDALLAGLVSLMEDGAARWAFRAEDAAAAERSRIRGELLAEIERDVEYWPFKTRRPHVTLGNIRAALDRICPEAPGEPEPAPFWQPIETAPEDGRVVLVVWYSSLRGYPRSARLIGGRWCDPLGDELLVVPSHWAPLPAGPPLVTPQASTHEIPGVGPVTVPEPTGEEG